MCKTSGSGVRTVKLKGTSVRTTGKGSGRASGRYLVLFSDHTILGPILKNLLFGSPKSHTLIIGVRNKTHLWY